MSHIFLTHGLALLCPWLTLVLCLQCAGGWFGGIGKTRWSRLGWSGLVAAGLLCWPIRGYSVAWWILGCSANFSVPLIGMLALAVAEKVTAHSLIDPAARWAGALFGCGAGLLLYPMALGLGPFDPYGWGWRFSGLTVVIAVLTGGLIWMGNRFGLLLLLAGVAFEMRLLESMNYWDYLVDPIYFVISLAYLITRLVRWMLGGPPVVQCSGAAEEPSIRNSLRKRFS